MTRHRIQSEEVLVADGGVVRVTAADVVEVRSRGARSPRRRARLCLHPGSEETLHEMVICLVAGTYVQPHRHVGKSESFHLIEGELDVVLFQDNGSVQDVIRMGSYRSGRTFLYRLMEPCYHTVLVKSPFVVFHETTNGPFRATETEFAQWAPTEADPAVATYMQDIRLICDLIGVA